MTFFTLANDEVIVARGKHASKLISQVPINWLYSITDKLKRRRDHRGMVINFDRFLIAHELRRRRLLRKFSKVPTNPFITESVS
jgi:hypothetical protein